MSLWKSKYLSTKQSGEKENIQQIDYDVNLFQDESLKQ